MKWRIKYKTNKEIIISAENFSEVVKKIFEKNDAFRIAEIKRINEKTK